jgi:hypothetical protein
MIFRLVLPMLFFIFLTTSCSRKHDAAFQKDTVDALIIKLSSKKWSSIDEIRPRPDGIVELNENNRRASDDVRAKYLLRYDYKRHGFMVFVYVNESLDVISCEISYFD